MAVNLSALAGAGQQFFTNTGAVLTGGKLYTYFAGTTTPQTSYTTAAGSTAHTNPIILDSAGRVSTGEIWITAGANYKFVLKDANDVLIATWDNITGINGTGISSNASNVQYDPAGTGAVATTVEAKLRQTISVKDFGATGDGTTDDSAALQAAINAAQAINATLYFPSGTYYYTSVLVVSNSMTITGDGYGSQLKPNTPSGNNFRINASNVLVEKIRMEGTSPGGFAVGFSGAVTNVTFQNCFFKDIGQVIWLWTVNDVTVQNCVFDATGYGIIQQNGRVSSFVLVDNCIARNMKSDFVEANCANLAPSQAWTITNNIYEGAQEYPVVQTEQRFVGITAVKNVVISGNNVQKTNGDSAIHLEDILGNTIISNNIFDNCLTSNSNFGYIYLLSSSEHTLIEGNIFLRSDSTLPLAYAIDVSSGLYANEIQIIGNRVVGNGSSGNFSFFTASSQTGHTVISGNYFEILASVMDMDNFSNLSFTGNYAISCGQGLYYADGNPSGGGFNNFTVVGNTFVSTQGSFDIRATTNTSGTNPPNNWFVNGNVFSKSVTIGDLGGGGASNSNNLTITNNVFKSTASLSNPGAPTNLVLFGNVFQTTGTTPTPTVPGLPNYANDVAAAAGGIQIGGMYRNGSVVQVRVS